MEMFDYTSIVVGTDGSSLAAPTVARAAWLAVHDDAELTIVCAMTQLSRRDDAKQTATLGGDAQVGQVPGESASAAALAAAVELAQQQGARVKAALLMEGEPATVLLETAERVSADLIVIGAIRDTSIAGRLLGTVATDVVRQANCEVLLVRPKGVTGELEVGEDA